MKTLKGFLAVLAVVVMVALCGTHRALSSDWADAEKYFMPAFWLTSGGAMPFKDIAGNALLGGNHDSIDFILSRPICTDNGVWYAYHWGWVYRTGVQEGNSIYRKISVDSIIAEQGDYIVLKKDIFDKDGYIWSPWKKLSKINWSLNDPIYQVVTEYNSDKDYCSEGRREAVLVGQNIWTLVEVLPMLENEFWDGTSKIWEGTILHLVENEPNGNKIDYFLALGKGLIRIRITAGDYIWLESGAY